MDYKRVNEFGQVGEDLAATQEAPAKEQNIEDEDEKDKQRPIKSEGKAKKSEGKAKKKLTEDVKKSRKKTN